MNSGENGENVILYHNQDIKVKALGHGRGRKRALDSFEAFLLTLVHCRCNFSVTHLAHLFETTESTVSTTFITWINFLYVKLGSLPIWPTKEQIKNTMPKSMMEKFPHVTCIIDCVEFKIAVLSSLVMHKVFYSYYKSHTTVKCLVGIVPGGGFSFISSVFPGSISDKEKTVRSGLLNPKLFKRGGGLMADRGFTIKEYSDK